jgi:glycerol-3-phosphate acyltransferase PlsY
MAINEKDLWLALVLSAQPWFVYAVDFAVGYACGSIPFGYIFGRLAGIGDIRSIGSGNIGATNVLRTGWRGLALLTLVSDAGKGFLPVIFARTYLGFEPALWMGVGAFAGHLFPIWLRFRGGKGVATYIGIVGAFDWTAGLFFCGAWLCVAVLTRYSSLSALVAAALTPFFILASGDYTLAIVMLCLSAILAARHRSNIANLIAGHESKIGQRTP